MLTEARIREKITALRADIRALERALELCSSPEPAKGTTRTDQLIAFLQAHQPMGSAEIAEKSGIPSGTVGAILSDNPMFVNDDGLWSIDAGQARAAGREPPPASAAPPPGAKARGGSPA